MSTPTPNFTNQIQRCTYAGEEEIWAWKPFLANIVVIIKTITFTSLVHLKCLVHQS